MPAHVSQLISIKMVTKKVNSNYICVPCKRQFIDHYQPQKGDPEEVKRERLKM